MTKFLSSLIGWGSAGREQYRSMLLDRNQWPSARGTRCAASRASQYPEIRHVPSRASAATLLLKWASGCVAYESGRRSFHGDGRWPCGNRQWSKDGTTGYLSAGKG
jgi:hypothetical protein